MVFKIPKDRQLTWQPQMDFKIPDDRQLTWQPGWRQTGICLLQVPVTWQMATSVSGTRM
jgi:hypothetical protein